MEPKISIASFQSLKETENIKSMSLESVESKSKKKLIFDKI